MRVVRASVCVIVCVRERKRGRSRGHEQDLQIGTITGQLCVCAMNGVTDKHRPELSHISDAEHTLSSTSHKGG